MHISLNAEILLLGSFSHELTCTFWMTGAQGFSVFVTPLFDSGKKPWLSSWNHIFNQSLGMCPCPSSHHPSGFDTLCQAAIAVTCCRDALLQFSTTAHEAATITHCMESFTPRSFWHPMPIYLGRCLPHPIKVPAPCLEPPCHTDAGLPCLDPDILFQSTLPLPSPTPHATHIRNPPVSTHKWVLWEIITETLKGMGIVVWTNNFSSFRAENCEFCLKSINKTK